MKIVLDTNVLVAGLLNPHGTPADILNLIFSEDVVLCYDDRIIIEYRSVLKRDKFRLKHEDVDIIVDQFEYLGIRVDPKPLDVTIDDPDDIMFYEVLIASSSDFLVTGNIKHFLRLEDKRIITPAGFMGRYFKK